MARVFYRSNERSGVPLKLPTGGQRIDFAPMRPDVGLPQTCSDGAGAVARRVTLSACRQCQQKGLASQVARPTLQPRRCETHQQHECARVSGDGVRTCVAFTRQMFAQELGKVGSENGHAASP